ncbi:class I SAM-dependent methyltransferase [Bradyrhizobium barranii subsp. apii]|uniref:Class I SAM-dependent methyltransferase n=1 Tax=Bradyrhizobium barranii subsp. apii TaxID=2819348 RepID=A0A8T5VMV5_9BRAD|nr:class I SAM-dependent methyltransferase [Bradyrhizobium barranii]UPT88638.1 class I SAM-dependent methyltransferase [Bradyrhizobium barranii subsp. apii]
MQAKQLEIPPYVAAHIQDYQLSEFRCFFDRVNVQGKRVLEVGSDYHQAIVRLFAANGASHVVGTNIGEWRSPEPLPANVEFLVGDAGDIDFDEKAFDIVYGTAILEHVPDLNGLAAQIKRILKPDGIGFLQGLPLWPGRLGHHVVVMKEREEFDNLPADEPLPFETLYDFAGNNPIPDWSHLVFSPSEMADYLVQNAIPRAHVDRIVNFVYSLDGGLIGSNSNYKSASDVIAAFQGAFEVEVDPVVDLNTNEYFTAALAKYSEADLRTLGLRLWLRPKR